MAKARVTAGAGAGGGTLFTEPVLVVNQNAKDGLLEQGSSTSST